MYNTIYNIYRSATDFIENLVGFSTSSSIWFWISLIQFLLLIILVYKTFKNKYRLNDVNLKRAQKMKLKKTSVNMDDLMHSINHAKELYKKLSRSCHPDLFIGKVEHEKALEIFQDVSRYKRDYKQLIVLQQKAEQLLNIKI